MNKYAILISSKAKSDIVQIYRYISLGLKSNLSALRLVENIEKAIRSLD